MSSSCAQKKNQLLKNDLVDTNDKFLGKKRKKTDFPNKRKYKKTINNNDANNGKKDEINKIDNSISLDEKICEKDKNIAQKTFKKVKKDKKVNNGQKDKRDKNEKEDKKDKKDIGEKKEQKNQEKKVEKKDKKDNENNGAKKDKKYQEKKNEKEDKKAKKDNESSQDKNNKDKQIIKKLNNLNIKEKENVDTIKIKKENNNFEENISKNSQDKEEVGQQLNDMKNFITSMDSKLSKLTSSIIEMQEEIKNQNIMSKLTNELMNQTEIYYNRNLKYLNKKMNMLVNSFEVLYFRKLSNLVLERIITRYKNKLAKTEKIFGKKFKFGIIVAKEDIGKISKFKVNLVIDFLKHVKQISSQIIHLRKLNKIIVKKEIFYDLLNIFKGNESNNTDNEEGKEKGIIYIDEISSIFSDSKHNEKKISKKKSTKLDKLFEKYILDYEEKEKGFKKEINEGKYNKDNTRELEESKEKEDDDDEENISEQINKEKLSADENEDGDEIDEIDKEKGDEEDSDKLESKSDEEDKNSEIFDAKKLTELLSEKESKNQLNISRALKLLKSKVNLNLKNTKINLGGDGEINSHYYYLSWKSSLKITYKKTNEFISFVNYSGNKVSLKDIGNIIKILLDGEKFYFFAEDPDNFENLIVETIEKY